MLAAPTFRFPVAETGGHVKRLPLLLAVFAAFQLFNYATTDYALTDLLGDLAILGVRWAVTLAFAFCAIDLVGIAPLFSPECDDDSGKAWYLFGAWVLASALNATLTWWGVSLALAGHSAGNMVPVVAAAMTWVLRVLILGTLWLEAANLWLARVSHRSFG